MSAMERAWLEEQLAAGRTLEEIGHLVDRHASTVGYWLKKHGLVATNHDRCAPKGGLAREALEPLVSQGLTTRTIARELGVGYSTARYWLCKHGLRASRPPLERPLAREATRRCRTHGETRFVLEGRGYYRCAKCRTARVADHRRRVKRILVQEAGGRCAACGFDSHPAALQFHHVDPSSKRFELSLRGVTRSIAELREEARKCVLLCSNCHALVEVGAIAI